MNVASLGLCRELFELSKWKPQDCAVYALSGDSKIFRFIRNPEPNLISMDYYIPAYALGYLLRKLPEDYGRGVSFQLCHQDNQWIAKYGLGLIDIEYADTPEDAACMLAIELFKQGVQPGQAPPQGGKQ